MSRSKLVTNIAELSSHLNLSPVKNKKPFKDIEYQLKYIIRFLFYYGAMKNYLEQISPETLELAKQAHQVSEKHQPFIVKAFYPYLVSKGSVKSNVRRIVNHYQFVESYLSKPIIDHIYNPKTPPLNIMKICVEDAYYSVVLVSDGWCKQEGEMSLRLLAPDGEKIYMLHFIIGSINGQRTMKIGALQGPKSSSENKQKIKQLTKTVYGLRPKDLIVRTGLYIAKSWDVKTVLAIKNNQHIWFNKRYKKRNKGEQVLADFEKHWKELGGKAFNSNFMELPIEETRKDLQLVKRTKRSMYKKRYDWLDDLQQNINKLMS